MKRKHYLLIAALSLSLTTAAAAATLTACGEDEVQSIQITQSVTGNYYTDDGGTEKTLELKLNSFKLNFGDGEKEGTYTSFENGTLLLTFDNGETATAVFKSDVVFTLNYGGREYTMYQKTNYTVRFEMDGGSAVQAQTVMNGKKATRPQDDPTRADSIFIGWYADERFTTEFDFNAPITESVKVYAKFIRRDVKLGVYKVNFDLGNGAGADENYPEVETFNRCVFNMPADPAAKDGKKFLGWWISDHNDATKLSAQYKGQELFEDTTFFAVWEGDNPAVSVTETGASWIYASAGAQYKVEIKNAADETVHTYIGGNTATSFDFGMAEEGEYTVTVTVNAGGADEKTATAYYKNRALVSVTKFTVEDDFFGFNAIETADKYLTITYELEIECGNDSHAHETNKELLGSTTGYDFHDCAYKAGGIKFRVIAKAEGYIASTSEWYVLERTLDSVTGLGVNQDEEEVTWNEVENAKSYKIEFFMGDAEEAAVTEEVTATSFDMRTFAAGEWKIKVTPLNKTYGAPQAAEFNYTKEKMATPTEVKIENRTVEGDNVDFVVWNAAAGATEGTTQYQVYLNGASYKTPTTDTFLSLADFDRASYGAQEIKFTVVTLGDEAGNNSLESDGAYVYDELQPPVYENGAVKWQNVFGVSEYRVTVGDGEEVTATESQRFGIAFDQAGETTIVVKGYASDGTLLTQNQVDVMVYAVTIKTENDEKFDKQYKADGDMIELPASLQRRGYRFNGWNYWDQNGETVVGAGTTEVAFQAGHTEIAANWVANQYTITLEVGDDGKPLPAETAMQYGIVFGTMNLKDGANDARNLPVPEYKNDDMEFIGWYSALGIAYTDNEGYMMFGWNLDSDTQLFARFGETGVQYVDDGLGHLMAGKQSKPVTLSTVTVLARKNGKLVTTLLENAFENCTSIKKLRLPSSIVNILGKQEVEGYYKENGQFESSITGGYYQSGSSLYGMNSLEEIEVYDVEGEDAHFKSIDGCLYSLDANGELDELLFVPQRAARTGTFRIADGTKSIGLRACYTMSNIEEVVIPASVTYIGRHAFASCSKLKKVTFLPAANGQLGQPLTVEDAFDYCYELKEITFPKRLADFKEKNIDTLDYGSMTLENIFIQELGDTKDKTTGYYDIDGVLCKGDTIVFHPKMHATTQYTIPTGIKKIGRKAFQKSKITGLRFPAAVSEIGERAFEDCTELKTVAFAGNKNSDDLVIRALAFHGCAAITELTLPANLKAMEIGAFGKTAGLAKVTLNAERSNLDYANGVFARIYVTRTGIEWEEGYKEKYQVYESKVQSVVLGEKVTEFQIAGVFGEAVKEVEINEGNSFYKSVNNVVYNKSETQIYFVPGALEEFVASDKLEVVGANVFKNNTVLRRVVFGAKVTTVADNAFDGCTALEEVEFEEGTVSLAIGKRAFYDCTALKTFTLYGRGSEAEITIDDEAFALKTAANGGMETITLPESVTSIGRFAFDNRQALRTVNLPASLETIGLLRAGDKYPSASNNVASTSVPNVSIFRGCANLENVNVAEGGEYFCSENGILFGKEHADEKDDTSPMIVTTLLFAGNQNKAAAMPDAYRDKSEGAPAEQFGYLAVPATVTKIADFAFCNNMTIKRVEFLGNPEKFEIGNGAFRDAKGLEVLAIPAGINEIAEGLFSGCISLKEVNIPNTVATIRQSAFAGCKSLLTVTFATGNDDLKLVIEDGTYKSGDGSDSGDNPDTSTGVFAGCEKLQTVIFPARLKTLGAYAFPRLGGYNNHNHYDSPTALTRVELPITVESIEPYAFYKCANLTTVKFYDKVGEDENEVKIEVPENFVGMTLKHHAFSGAGFTNIDLPDTLKTIEPRVFDGVALKKLSIPASVEEIKDNYETMIGSSVTTTKSVTLGMKEDALEEIEFKTVAESDEENAPKVSKLKSLPESTGTDGVFKGYKNLQKVNLDALNLVTAIPRYAFYGCSLLNNVTLNESVTEIGDHAFDECTSLQKFHYWHDQKGEVSKLGKIGSGAFRKTALEEFIFPTIETGTLTLGNAIFEGCAALKDVHFSKSVVDISSGPLAKAPNLKNVTKDDDCGILIDSSGLIFVCLNPTETNAAKKQYEVNTAFAPVSLTGKGVFNLPETYNGGKVVSIGVSAFSGQNLVRKVVIPASVQTIKNSAFEKCLALQTVEFAANSSLTSIGEKAFAQTSSMISMELPNSVKELGFQCFANSGIQTIRMPNVLTKMGKQLFYQSGLREVTNFSKLNINPESANYDGSRPFDCCNGLRSVTFAEGATAIPSGMFYYCYGLEEIDLTGITTVLNLYNKNYSESLFERCFDLRKITFDANMKVLPHKGVFCRCDSLTTILRSDRAVKQAGETDEEYVARLASMDGKWDLSQIESTDTGSTYGNLFGTSTVCPVKEIDLRNLTTCGKTTSSVQGLTFEYCPLLEKVILNAAYSYAAPSMFKGAKSLKTLQYFENGRIVGDEGAVTLPKQIKVLSASMFTGADTESAPSIERVLIPEGITELGDSVFEYCKNLTTVQYYKTLGGVFDVFGEEDEITLPSNCTKFGSYVFSNCPEIRSVDMSSVTKIGTSYTKESAATAAKLYSPHRAMFANCGKLEEVKLNDAITQLGSYTFFNCTSLKSIKLPKQLTYLGSGSTNTAVFQNSGLESIILPVGVTKLGTYASGTKLSGTGIYGYMFKDCKALKEVYVSQNFEGMENDIFSGCSELKTFKIYEATAQGDPVYDENGKIKEAASTKFAIIGARAFDGCGKLESIDISKITKLGTNAFQNCKGFKKFDLSGVEATNLGVWASMTFQDFTALEEVKLGSLITELSANMFKGCSSLTTVDCSKVTAVGANAFNGCSSLQTLTLSGECASIGANAFDGCTRLSTVYRSDTEAANRVEGEADFSQVTSFGNGAFTNCDALTSVKLNVNLTTLSDSMFSGCDSLTKINAVSGKNINLPTGLTTIQGSALCNCPSLGDVQIPASVTEIGAFVFIGSKNANISVAAGNEKYALNANGWLTQKDNGAVLFVPYQVKGSADDVTEVTFAAGAKLYSYMLSYYTSIEKVTLPNDLMEIPANAFYNFRGSFGADFQIPATVRAIGNGAFQNCTLGTVIIPEGVTSVGTAFRGATIEKLVLPSTVTTIDANAFRDANIGAIEFKGNITSIGNSAFVGATLPATFTLPNTLTSVGDYAFQSSTLGGELVIPVGLTSINKYAFSRTAITKVTLHSRITDIGEGVFWQCAELENVAFKAIEADAAEFVNKCTIGASAFRECVSLTGSLQLPSGITTVGNYAFQESTMGAMVFGDGLQKLGEYAFKGCNNLTSVSFGDWDTSPADANCTTGSYTFKGLPELQTVTFNGKGPKQFGTEAFMDCVKLTTVNIPYTTKTITGKAFFRCESLTTLTFDATPDGETEVSLTISAGAESALALNNTPSAEIYILDEYGHGYSGAFAGTGLNTVVLPERLAATGLGQCTFYKSKIKSITLPHSLTSIGKAAFMHSGLTSVTIPYTLTTISEYAFAGCKDLTTLTFEETPEGVTPTVLELKSGGTAATPGVGTAYVCKGLENTTGMNVSQEYIKGVFAGCEKLSSVTLPARLKIASAATFAFAGTGVTEVNLGGIATIPDGMFAGCKNLTKVEIPAGTTNLGTRVFAYCSSLAELNIPKTITSIGSQMFAGTAIEKVVIPFNVTIQYGTFMNWNGKIIIDIEGNEMGLTTTTWSYENGGYPSFIGVSAYDYDSEAEESSQG